MNIQPARSDDLGEVRQLLASEGLPASDLEGQFPSAFIVARAGAELVAAAALERHGEVGLLRSVAVAPHHRGAGLARALVEDRLRAAGSESLRQVYLLTTTAPEYFARLGFVRVPRASVPPELQRSSEFASLCPASAVCMVATPR